MAETPKSEPIDDDDDDEWSDENVDLGGDDWAKPLSPAGESRRAAFRRTIEIAREERALMKALDDFSDN